MFLFTNYVPDVQSRYDMGGRVLYLVAVNIIINFLVLIAILVKKIYTIVRLWLIKRHNRIEGEKAIIRRALKASQERESLRKSKLLELEDSDSNDADLCRDYYNDVFLEDTPVNVKQEASMIVRQKKQLDPLGIYCYSESSKTVQKEKQNANESSLYSKSNRNSVLGDSESDSFERFADLS